MGYDLATTRGLVKVHAQYAEAFPINTFLMKRYFGGAPIISRFPYVTIETKRKGRKVATQVRRGEGPIEQIARDNHSRTVYEPPYFSEKSAVTADDLTKFSYGETVENPFDNKTKILSILAEKQHNLDERYVRTEELQCAEILLNGKVKMVDNSYIIFGADAALIGVNPAVKWDTSGGTGVVILDNLKTWMFAVRDKSGVLPNEIVVTSDVHVLMVNNALVQKAMDVKNYDFGRATAVNLEQYGDGNVTDGGYVRVPGAGYLQIYVYHNAYDAAGTLTPYLPAGTVLMLNKTNLGRMSYAATNGTIDGFPAFIPGARNASVIKASGDSEEAAIVLKMAPLAQPISLDTWLSANVLVNAS